jgi:hypothetical protein
MFLPSFIPIATTNAATEVFVDCRPGPRSGCVTEYLREEADRFGVRWGSVGAMLADVADSLENRRRTGHWLPFIEDGRLDWIVADAAEAARHEDDWDSPIDGPHGQPEDPEQAEAEIRYAFARALTGGGPAEQVLAEVEDGASLADALAEARMLQPDATSTSRVEVSAVQFLDPTRARVPFHVNWDLDVDMILSGSSFTGLAVLVGGEWKVARASYCEVLRLAGARC